jgi:hypothetical protein
MNQADFYDSFTETIILFFRVVLKIELSFSI